MESPEAIPGLEARLTQYIQRYVAQNGNYAKVNRDAGEALPGGTTRAVLSHQPFPIAFKGGHGPFVTSLDDDEYIDFVSEYCAAMIGHSHPDIVAAVHRIADGGLLLEGQILVKENWHASLPRDS
uniref:Glutamate-1-semialdehyde 2,1-aminomutase n=1 Tax=Bionectria ochroleuca TaxID=29856 RepID=A0A8H7TQQ5_BIOOC